MARVGTAAGAGRGRPTNGQAASNDYQSPHPPRAVADRIGRSAHSEFLHRGHRFFVRRPAHRGRRSELPSADDQPLRRAVGRLASLISPPHRPHGWVQCVAFSPDGTKLAWGEVIGEVAVWDRTHNRLVFRQKYHGHSVNDVAFSPDGRILATGGEDGMVRLLRAEDPRETVQTLATGEQTPVRRGFTGVPAGGFHVGPPHLAFTPDGARLIVGSGSSATISIWRIKDGGLERRIENAHGNSREANPSLASIAVTPDGKLILSAGQRTVPITQTKLKFIEVETGRTRWTKPPAEERAGFVQLAGMKFPSGSPFLAVAMRDGNVVRFNALTGREQRRGKAKEKPSAR